jgi:hypothetical protein
VRGQDLQRVRSRDRRPERVFEQLAHSLDQRERRELDTGVDRIRLRAHQI